MRQTHCQVTHPLAEVSNSLSGNEINRRKTASDSRGASVLPFNPRMQVEGHDSASAKLTMSTKLNKITIDRRTPSVGKKQMRLASLW